MTDEEKAEITKEYLNNTFKQTEANQLAIMIGSKCFYEGLEKGLAEGRKESKLYIELLQNEKAELSEDFCKQLEELKTQIKKMKCCGNCSKKYQCEMNVIDSLHCDKWELAE